MHESHTFRTVLFQTIVGLVLSLPVLGIRVSLFPVHIVVFLVVVLRRLRLGLARHQVLVDVPPRRSAQRRSWLSEEAEAEREGEREKRRLLSNVPVIARRG